MDEITLIVEFAVKPGRLDGYRIASAAMRAAVERDEPDTLRYDWWLDETEARGLNIEIFADSAALATHMRNSEALVGDLVEAVDVVRVEVLGELTDEGHAAIDAAATGHFRLVGGIDR